MRIYPVSMWENRMWKKRFYWTEELGTWDKFPRTTFRERWKDRIEYWQWLWRPPSEYDLHFTIPYWLAWLLRIDEGIRIPFIDRWQSFQCRRKGHPKGAIWYNPGGFYPDDRCATCGDRLDIGF